MECTLIIRACFLSFAVFVAANTFAAQVCKMRPEINVKFENPWDVYFPRPKSPGKDDTYAIEQFIKPESKFEEPTYIVRDAKGGLHLANGYSLKAGLAQRGIKYLADQICPAGDADIADDLLKAFRKQEFAELLEAAERLSKLPDDKALCEPNVPVQLSLDDKSFAAVDAPKPPPPNPYATGMGNPYGMGLIPDYGSSWRPRLRANTFRLQGQVLSKADAPESFDKIQYRPGDDDTRWRSAEVGMYLLRDETGRLHAVKPEQLAPASLNKMKSGHFVCKDVAKSKDGGRPVIREIKPEQILRDPPATTAH